ncbi:MAG: GNAT family N-acetyltransferase [Chloroflexota bacterium]|nr:MAG: GNAT family N-acetyltransferase [Chloroflexota bacterium]
MRILERNDDLIQMIASSPGRIASVRPEDADEMARMWRESGPGWNGEAPYGGSQSTPERVLSDVADIDALDLFLAWETDLETGERRAAGFLSLFRSPTDADTAYVGVLSAHPRWHGTGVGRDLLKAALARTVELGFARLDLHTWPGNAKAIPLYKKSGYFWIPGDTVHMENYLPSIFRLDAARRFFRMADWYRDLRRDLAPREDDAEIDGLGVYVYHWEKDGRRLTITIDRHAKAIVGIDCDEYKIGHVSGRARLLHGALGQTHWVVENRQSVALPLNLHAQGEDAVTATALHASSLAPGQRVDVAIDLAAGVPAASLTRQRPNHRVHASVSLGEDRLQLARSTDVTAPFTGRLEGSVALTPGTAGRAWLVVENHRATSFRGSLMLVADVNVLATPAQSSIDVSAGATLAIPLELLADRSGRFRIRGGLVDRAGVGAGSIDVWCDAVAPGHAISAIDETTARLMTRDIAVSTPLVSAEWRIAVKIAHRVDGETIANTECSFGPPYFPSSLVGHRWEAKAWHDGGSAHLILRATPPDDPTLSYERHITLTADGVIEHRWAIANHGSAQRSMTVESSTRHSEDDLGASMAAAPIAGGVTRDAATDWPDWRDGVLKPADVLDEGWIALERDGWTHGTLWHPGIGVRMTTAHPTLSMPLEVPPGERVETKPVYLVVGRGDWRLAADAYAQLVARRDTLHYPTPRRAVVARVVSGANARDSGSAGIPPAAGSRAPINIAIDSHRARPLDGDVWLERDGNAISTKATVAGLRISSPVTVTVTLTNPVDAPVEATIVFRHDREVERFPTALLPGLGQAAETIRSSLTIENVEIERVESPFLAIDCAPKQLGRITRLARPGSDGSLIAASFPEPSQRNWWGPWHGGVTPYLHRDSSDDWRNGLRDIAMSLADSTSGESIAVETDLGTPEKPDLALRIAYSILPGTPLLVARLRATNQSPVPFRGEIGFDVWPEIDSARPDAGIITDSNPNRSYRPIGRTINYGAGRWVTAAVAGGEWLTVGRGAPTLHLSVVDVGVRGAAINARAPAFLEPGASAEVAIVVGVSPTIAESQAIARLADV